MDKELKTKWVAALRGGNYKQAQGCLRDSNGFCCLGVLLDVAAKGEWQDEDAGVYSMDGVRGFDGDLGSYREDFELSKEQEKLLVKMNDGDDKIPSSAKNFTEIADYIEATL